MSHYLINLDLPTIKNLYGFINYTFDISSLVSLLHFTSSSKVGSEANFINLRQNIVNLVRP